tara:strand:+ start:166 stop:378 length:213 start_codon:yes stop_codon:yes gene_type:complete
MRSERVERLHGKEIMRMLETETGRAEVIQLVLMMQSDIDKLMGEIESSVRWTRDNHERSIELARERGNHD